MSGNPVKIGDGCATVTGYKLPSPLIRRIGKAGARLEARSQDTGLVVLVRVCFQSPARVAQAQLLRQREG
jgi:hypothetical protein